MSSAVNIEAAIDNAQQRCTEHGVRLTEKRKQLLSGLLQSGTALSAYELADYCRDQYSLNIPAMSVYRILDFLQSQQLVHKLNLANKYVACAHINCQHDHGVPQFLICNSCKRVEEIHVDQAQIDALQHSIEQANFLLLSPQLEFNCLCEQCQ